MCDVSAFRVDDQRDQDLASDRSSRYGAYLSQKHRLFHYDGAGSPADLMRSEVRPRCLDRGDSTDHGPWLCCHPRQGPGHRLPLG